MDYTGIEEQFHDKPASWTWDSHKAMPCGYVIQLDTWDLTIYDSNPESGYHTAVNWGYCVSPAKITCGADGFFAQILVTIARQC